LWSLKAEQWGSPLVQEKYREEKAVTKDDDDDDDNHHHYYYNYTIIILLLLSPPASSSHIAGCSISVRRSFTAAVSVDFCYVTCTTEFSPRWSGCPGNPDSICTQYSPSDQLTTVCYTYRPQHLWRTTGHNKIWRKKNWFYAHLPLQSTQRRR
jgi:hypothetical protein